MRGSTDRILITHTGSLPRSTNLAEQLRAKEAGERLDLSSKTSPNTHSGWRESGAPSSAATYGCRYAPGRPIEYTEHALLQKDLDNLKAALTDASPEEVFMTAASPGLVAHFCKNEYYDSEEGYLYALADAMKVEYDAIFRSGFVLQVDCPDLTMSGWERLNYSSNDLNRIRELHVEALNHALRDIPTDRLRMHLCWGNSQNRSEDRVGEIGGDGGRSALGLSRAVVKRIGSINGMVGRGRDGSGLNWRCGRHRTGWRCS
jgi:methionine synthase II (cobalamin-independent)